MSSFRWGMIACPTPRNSQVTARKAGALPFSYQFWIVLLTALHSEVWLTSASLPLNFGLSLCNPLEQISPLYALWEGTYMSLIWGIEAWSATKGCIAIKLIPDLSSFASYSTYVIDKAPVCGWNYCSFARSHLLGNCLTHTKTKRNRGREWKGNLQFHALGRHDQGREL